LWTIMPYYLRAMEAIRKPFSREEGQGLVEYALILVLVALIVIGALILLGERVRGVFQTIDSSLESGINAAGT